jgi:hypothetical protein
MALTKKVRCVCQLEGYKEKFHPELTNRPSLCVWCYGAGKVKRDVHLDDDYEGEFKSSSLFLDVSDDTSIDFDCVCGEHLHIFGIGSDPLVCVCGRIYRTTWKFEVDESHIGETRWLIEQSKREYEEIIYE